MATQVEVDNEGNEYPLRVTGEILADAVIEAVSSGITKVNEINGEAVHGNLLDKLDKLLETKEGITNAIQDIGVSLPDDTPFALYPQYIVEILSVVAGSLLIDVNYFADQLLNILGNEDILGGQSNE